MGLEPYRWPGAIATSLVRARPPMQDWLDHVPQYAKDAITPEVWAFFEKIDWNQDIDRVRAWLAGLLEANPIPETARLLDIQLGEFFNSPPELTIMAHDVFDPEAFQFGVEGPGDWPGVDAWYELTALAELMTLINADDDDDEEEEEEETDDSEQIFFAISGLALAHTTLLALQAIESEFSKRLADAREPLRVIAGIHDDDPVLIGTISSAGWVQDTDSSDI